MENKYDVVIIGGGPIGLSCAIEAQKHNLSYVILEKGALTNSLYNYPLYMTFFSTAEKLEVGNIPFNCIAPKPGRQEALDYYRNVVRYFKLNIKLYQEVTAVNKLSKDCFHVATRLGATYIAKNVIVATGFYDIPNLMNIPGENLPKVHHYFKEAHPFALQKVVVIGANNSAVDAALECYRKGADVTMIIRGSEFTHRLKYWVKPDIENRIKEGSINAYFNATLCEIQEDKVIFIVGDEQCILENDVVLALTGYQPNFNFLEKIGIEFNEDEWKTPIYNADTMETNISGIYLAGVVCGGLKTNMWFIENSRIHAELIIVNIINKNND